MLIVIPIIGGLCDHKSSPHWRSNNLSSNAFKELCDDARLNDLRLRSRRLTCSAFLLDYGVDYEIARRISRHSDNLHASNIYASVRNVAIRNAVKSAVWGNKPGTKEAFEMTAAENLM